MEEDSSIVLSTFSGNNADVTGGGIATQSIDASGVLTIESSTISNNTASIQGIGGGLAVIGGDVRILNSTVSGNEAGDGGGILVQESSVQLLNSTISGNRAQRQGGGIFFTEIVTGSLLVRLTTVANNSASIGGGSLVIARFSANADAIQLDHSIVANGAPLDVAGFGASSTTLTANYTLIEAPGTTVLVGANNVIGAAPLLSPLGSYGGPTLTHRLLSGSPALDAGNPAIPNPPATDQRGAARIVGPAIDLGSVEGLELTEVPTLSEVGLFLLCVLLLAAGVQRLRLQE